jgi:hypothetical protein
MAALPKIVEEIVSGVLVVFEFFHFMWALLMEVVLFTANNFVIMRSSTPALKITWVTDAKYTSVQGFPFKILEAKVNHG